MLQSSFVISLMYLIPFSIQDLLYMVLFPILMLSLKKIAFVRNCCISVEVFLADTCS